MSIYDCPAELLHAFVEACADPSDLRSLRSVDKAFCTLATPLAFRTVHFRDTSESCLKLSHLATDPDLSIFVQTLDFRSRDHEIVVNGRIRHVYEDIEDTNIRSSLVHIFSTLHVFPSLQILQIHFFTGESWEDVVPAPDGTLMVNNPSKYYLQQDAILHALLSNDSPVSLRSLTLENLIPFPSQHLDRDVFAQLLSPLQELHVSVHAMHFSLEEVGDRFWVETIPLRFLAPPQQQLTVLSLVSDQPVGYLPRIDFSGLYYPTLRSLKLGGFTFDQHRHIENFIVLHGPTLTSLVLDSCPMIGDGLGLQPWRRWAEVCARFEEVLTALVDVHFLLRTTWGLGSDHEPREEMRLTYESSSTGYGYNRGMRYADELVRQDEIAMQRLVAVVHARRNARQHTEHHVLPRS